MKSFSKPILPLAIPSRGLESSRRSISRNLSRQLGWLLCLVVRASGVGITIWAADSGDSKSADKKEETASDKKAEKPVPKEEASVTHAVVVAKR